MIKTRKIEIIPVGNKKFITETIKRYSEESCQMANEVVRGFLFSLIRFDDFKAQNPGLNSKELSKAYSELYGLSVRGSAYSITRKFDISSPVRAALSNVINKTLTKNKKEILTNRVSIPSFIKNKMPVYFVWRGISLYKKDETYHFTLRQDLTFKLHFGRDRSNNKSIIDKVLSGEYKGCDSSITIEDNKMFLNLSFKFEPKEVITKNDDVVLGIDLGINRPVTMARSDLKDVQQIEIGQNMSNTRLQFKKRRRELSKSLKFSKGGHGRKDKMKKLYDIGKKEYNYCTTMNHKISKLVIDYCKKEGISKIKMEDLTGITKDSNIYFLKSWSYFQIQQFISYKGAECGISIEFVVPVDTSKTCHCCGTAQDHARDKYDVSKYTCMMIECDLFGKTQDADVNAAKNIAKKESFKEKPKSKKGRIEDWKKKQEILD